MEKIGLLGASFNPIHTGHLIMAEQARQRYGLDKVLFIPSYRPYHKNVEMVDYRTRADMVELAIAGNEGFELSLVEENIEKNSYSYDTVREIKKLYKDASLYFILGEDSLLYIHKWYRYEDFLSLVKLIVFRRDQETGGDFWDQVKMLEDKGYEVNVIDDMKFQISSSFIRKSIKNSWSVSYLLPDKVETYIEDRKLYR